MTNKQKAIKRLKDLELNIRENHDFCQNEINQIESIINFINNDL